MIQIYKPSNTEYDKNGDMTLFPVEAKTHAVLNGAWEAELEHPIDPEGRWKYIQDESVLKMPSFNGEQLFRIKKKRKSENGILATAVPVFWDAKEDCYLRDVRPTNVNGQQALNQMLAPNQKYSGESDIKLETTAYYQDKNLLEALNGNEENSFLNRWGGEILFDNFKVLVNRRVGGDYGVEILYGKNIEKDGITEEVDFQDVITRIYPKSYNGHALSGAGYVDSPLIDSYTTIKCATATFQNVKMQEDAQEGDAEKGIILCSTQEELDEALTRECEKKFNSGVDKPNVTVNVKMVLLEGTEEYRDYQMLERISLGDTVHCKHADIGIITDARVMELTFDAIDEKVKEVVIGKTGNEYFNGLSDAATRIDTAIRPDGTVIGQQIQGIIDMAAAQMKLQSTKAKKQNVRAILFEDKDPESPLYGAMCLGTQGFQIASKRTADGRDWDWSTFGNANGFFADLIVAGTMLADRIRGGELISMEYEEGEKGFKLDLNNGIMKAVQLLIETKKKGRMEKGFRFKDGNLEVLGIDDKVIASIHCCGSLPDNPDDLPSGWPDKVVFAGGEPFESYTDGFWVEGREAAGVRCNKLEVHTDNDTEVFVGGNIEAEIRKKVIINKKETKTGRAEFSDGTYLEFVNGFLVGGNAKAGGF